MAADGKLTIWMRLRNAQQVIAGLKATAVQTGLLGTATDRLARHLERASRRTWIMNQALFTLRRYAYMTTLALTAGIAVVAKWGFDYNAQVQEARIAFAKFGLTQTQVTDEIQKLYRIAAISPFLFTDITRTGRRFLAFGMNIHDTNRTVRNLADSLVALGVATPAALNRASLALAHMMSLGRVTGQIIYQLARDNVPIIQALETELGLTGDQLRNVARLGIPASVAINALNKYIEDTPKFHGAALLFATKTWRGIITTSRDYMAQFMGAIEKPLFTKLQKEARRFLFWITDPRVNRLAAKGDILGVIGTFSPHLAMLVGLLFQNLRAVWQVLVNGVIPAFMYMVGVVGPPLYAILWVITQAMGFLGDHAWITRVFFALLALELGVMAARFLILLPLQATMLAWYIAYNTVQKISIALGIARLIILKDETGAVILQTVVLTKFGKVLKLIVLLRFREAAAMVLTNKMWRLWTALTVGSIRGAKGQFTALSKLEIMVLKMRRGVIALTLATKGYILALWGATRAMILFLFTNPVGWAILLAGALVVLYWKWARFRNIVNETFRIIIFGHGPLATALRLAFGPLTTAYGAALDLYRIIVRIKNLASGGSRKSFLHGLLGGAARALIPGAGFIPGLAGGGMVTRGGAFMVGEAGPELAYMPTGAAVRPLGRGGDLGGGLDMSGITIEFNNRTTLEADGRQLAEVVSKHRLDGQARR